MICISIHKTTQNKLLHSRLVQSNVQELSLGKTEPPFGWRRLIDRPDNVQHSLATLLSHLSNVVANFICKKK